jgi:hypothetical protein
MAQLPFLHDCQLPNPHDIALRVKDVLAPRSGKFTISICTLDRVAAEY